MVPKNGADSRPWVRIDQVLADAESSFDFLTLISPTNLNEAWESFRADGCEKEPQLVSPKLHFRLEDVRAAIDELPLRDVDDADVRFLLAGKREELRWELAMLEVRDTPEFLIGSLLHYGPVSYELLKTAQQILDEVPAEKASGDVVTADEVEERAEEELEAYRRKDSSFEAELRQEANQDGLQAEQGDLLIPTDIQLAPERLEALIQHEVGAHVVTYYNGARQPLQILRNGLADYDEVQEAFGILGEYFAGGLTNFRLRMLAARTIAVYSRESGASFTDTFRLLRDEIGMSPSNAFSTTARIYACGGFTRDQIYLRGLVWLLGYIGSGGDLEPLYTGKLGRNQIPSVIRLRRRGFLQEPALRPAFLEGEANERKLERLRAGLRPADLVSS